MTPQRHLNIKIDHFIRVDGDGQEIEFEGRNWRIMFFDLKPAVIEAFICYVRKDGTLGSATETLAFYARNRPEGKVPADIIDLWHRFQVEHKFVTDTVRATMSALREEVR